MGKTAIIYARVSTARQADDGLPVESQIEQCRAKASSIGARVVQVFRDDGISGRTSKRPGLLGAFSFVEEQRIDYFICWSTSRFARNRLDAALHKRLLDKIGVRLVYASQEFGEGDDGWLAESITEVIDEQYSRQIAKDTRRSMIKNAKDGFFNGGPVPFGYRAVSAGRRKRLEIEPAEVPTVRLIFTWCAEGSGTKDIARRLNHAGIAKRGRRWDKATVSSVLKSRAVCGYLVFRAGDKEIATLAHDAIISEEDFMRAKELIQARAPRVSGGRARSDAVFVGMLRCGACGDAMTTETATGRGGVRYHYYNCRAFLKGAGCHSRRLSVDALDKWLLSGILDKVFTPDNLREIVLDVKQSTGAWIKEHEARMEALTAEQADIKRRLRRLYETIEAGGQLELADIAPRLRELKARGDAIAQEIAIAQSETAPTVTLSENEVESAAAMFRDLVESCEDPRRVRMFLSRIVRRAVIDGDAVRVEYYPERIVNQNSGSHCVKDWLPNISTMRNACIMLPAYMAKSDKKTSGG